MIDYDNISGVETLMKHLMALGHQKIGIVYSEPELRHHGERLETFQRMMGQNNLVVTPSVQVHALTRTTEGGKYAALQLLQQYQECTAIFALNDRLAFGVCQAIQMTGRKIPQDVTVVGFDDVDLAAYFSPSLTTVQVPYWKMGNRAALLISQYLDSGQMTKEKIVEPTQLIIRESSYSISRAT